MNRNQANVERTGATEAGAIVGGDGSHDGEDDAETIVVTNINDQNEGTVSGAGGHGSENDDNMEAQKEQNQENDGADGENVRVVLDVEREVDNGKEEVEVHPDVWVEENDAWMEEEDSRSFVQRIGSRKRVDPFECTICGLKYLRKVKIIIKKNIYDDNDFL